MSRQFIVPYKMGSKSAKSLANRLRVKQSRGIKVFRPATKLINWGKSDLQLRGRRLSVLNRPEVVKVASNKLFTFRALRSVGVPTVEFTTDKNVAYGWADENTVVYARQTLTGNSGMGIVVVGMDDRMPDAPLYTKGFNKSHEFRVHVIGGQVVDFTKKRRRDGTDNNNFIKNLSNGWVFCRDGVVLPSAVRAISLAAVAGLGLDFGAVDILYRERSDEARVLEINTAPGLEGTTLERYAEALGRMIV